MILTKLSDLVGESTKSVIEIAAKTEEIVAGVRAKTAEDFAARGVTLTSVYAEYIGPTEETAKAIDERASMGAIGDMQAYMQFQAARGMRDAAQQSGGTAGAGVGLGAGVGMGAAMAQMMSQSMQQPAQQQSPQQSQQGGGQSSAPRTAQEIQSMLDNLDTRLMNGEISEDLYNRLREKWQGRLEDLE
jgi:membrane protease subunit (stomatin/prohibitin family)